MRAVFLFRKDLRLEDHPALNKAIESADSIVYALKKPEDHDSWGVWRQKFWLESALELKTELLKKGQHLYLVSHDEKFLDYDCVFLTKEYAYEEQREEESFHNVCALPGDELYNDLSFLDLPTQFTPFRKYVEKNHTPLGVYPRPDFSRAQACEGGFHGGLTWPSLPERTFHPQTSFPFCGGVWAAHQRLEQYFFKNAHVLSYKQTRNQMWGTEGSTKLSAWLALGALSPRQIYAELKRFEQLERADESTYWVFFELLWREFFRWMCRRYGRNFFCLSGIKEEKPEFISDKQKIEAWKQGETGEAIVDACMKELVSTGFLSNRGRQVAASFFVNELHQDWRTGARFYEQHLVDYDVYSNWGNWMYLAGVGFDPRGKRWFNPQKQALQYDPSGEFRRLWTS